MANLEVKITTAIAPLEKLTSKLQNPAPLYKAWANHLESITVQAFKAESEPYNGSPWKPLKPATIRRKLKRKSPPSKNKILRDTGTLYNTITAFPTATGAVVGTNQAVGQWSLGAIHQFGAPKANIEARRFLPMDANGNALPQLEREIDQLTQDYFNA